MKKTFILFISLMMMLPVFSVTSAMNSIITQKSQVTLIEEDLDPLVDLSITVTIKQIRTLEKTDLGIKPLDKIDATSDPDFYVKVLINNEEFTSPVWENTKYVTDPQWSATANVPDDIDDVNISIQLWDANPNGDKLCDLSGVTEDDNGGGDLLDKRYVTLDYNLKTGHWTGDDKLEQNTHWDMPDLSGYGRLNGCDDGSIYQSDRDCELWFDITQNDFDNDGIPYFTEVNIFNTDPTVDNRGEDFDNDSIPIEWEWKWGYYMTRNYHDGGVTYAWRYNPLVWEDHANIDDDEDGLNNIEEYLTSQWGSDPFRKDLFVELDQMASGPNGEAASILPEGAKDLLRTAYDRYNIVYHLDDGSWENSGSDTIPFDEETSMAWGDQLSELMQIYNDYFLHGDPNNWRLGVFHYGVMVYQCNVANGNAFGSNRYQISSNGLNQKAASLPWLNRDIVYASAYMHECGHTLSIENPGVDDQISKFPWQIDWWKWRPYKSVMNYGYMYLMVDYSDGSRGKYDFDDWHDLDMTSFQQQFY